MQDNPVKDDGLSSRRREFKHGEKLRFAASFPSESLAESTHIMKIKLLLKKDLSAAHKMHQNYIGGYLYDFFKQEYEKRPTLFVACYDGKKLIGVCWGYKDRHNAILAGIAVNIKYQKKGIGARLLEAFEKQVKKIKIHKISIAAANVPINVVGFYEKANYKIIKSHKQYTTMKKKI